MLLLYAYCVGTVSSAADARQRQEEANEDSAKAAEAAAQDSAVFPEE